jgi:hypothetical protein
VPEAVKRSPDHRLLIVGRYQDGESALQSSGRRMLLPLPRSLARCCRREHSKVARERAQGGGADGQ